jgi:hypothetical protein
MVYVYNNMHNIEEKLFSINIATRAKALVCHKVICHITHLLNCHVFVISLG